MLQQQQDMIAVGDGLAAEDDTHVAWAWLQAKARFGRRDGERRSTLSSHLQDERPFLLLLLSIRGVSASGVT